MLESLGLSKAGIAGGAIGAAISALQGNNRTRTERVLNFLAGFGIASYVPSLIISYFALKETPSIYGGLGFFLGFFGMAIFDALMQAAKNLKDLNWKEILESWLKR